MTEFYPELKMQKQVRVAQKRWSAPGARPTERDTEIVRALLVAQSPVTEIAAQHRTSASNVYRIARKYSIERKRHVGHSPGNAAA